MDDVNSPSNPVETTMTKTLRTLSLVELLNAALLIGSASCSSGGPA